MYWNLIKTPNELFLSRGFHISRCNKFAICKYLSLPCMEKSSTFLLLDFGGFISTIFFHSTSAHTQ